MDTPQDQRRDAHGTCTAGRARCDRTSTSALRSVPFPLLLHAFAIVQQHARPGDPQQHRSPNLKPLLVAQHAHHALTASSRVKLTSASHRQYHGESRAQHAWGGGTGDGGTNVTAQDDGSGPQSSQPASPACKQASAIRAPYVASCGGTGARKRVLRVRSQTRPCFRSASGFAESSPLSEPLRHRPAADSRLGLLGCAAEDLAVQHGQRLASLRMRLPCRSSQSFSPPNQTQQSGL